MNLSDIIKRIELEEKISQDALRVVKKHLEIESFLDELIELYFVNSEIIAFKEEEKEERYYIPDKVRFFICSWCYR